MFFQSHLKLDVIPEIKRLRPHAKDNLFLCDASGFHDKMSQLGLGSSRVINNSLLTGDLSRVKQSEKMLKKLSEEQFLSRMWSQTSDVVGALPNVPAFIAGQPLNMRRRNRLKRPAGPLSIFLECTGSGSSMGNSVVQAGRGAALLALTQVLSEQRAVELWVCVTFGTRDELNGLICKVETTPLDLARAAWMLTSLNEMSMMGSYTMTSIIGHHPGSWAYGTPDLERRYSGEIFGRFLSTGSEVLYVPAMFSHDPLVSDPYGWLKNMLVKYGGNTYERGDEEQAGEVVTGFVEFST